VGSVDEVKESEAHMNLFSCQNCQVKYAIIRRGAPPKEPPVCEVCNYKFPPTESGDWLTYQRADPIIPAKS
jgi:hypothetical protein